MMVIPLLAQAVILSTEAVVVAVRHTRLGHQMLVVPLFTVEAAEVAAAITEVLEQQEALLQVLQPVAVEQLVPLEALTPVLMVQHQTNTQVQVVAVAAPSPVVLAVRGVQAALLPAEEEAVLAGLPAAQAVMEAEAKSGYGQYLRGPLRDLQPTELGTNRPGILLFTLRPLGREGAAPVELVSPLPTGDREAVAEVVEVECLVGFPQVVSEQRKQLLLVVVEVVAQAAAVRPELRGALVVIQLLGLY
jgi:hypothetical protein